MKGKLTKFMSMLVAMVMLISTFSAMSVLAATTTETTAAGTIDELQKVSLGTVSYAEDNAYSGSRSLKIVTDGNDTFFLPSSVYFLAGTYDFEYYIYPKTVGNRLYARMSYDGTENNVCIYQDGAMKTGQLNTKTYIEAVENPSVGSGIWYKVTGKGYTTDNSSNSDCGLLSLTGTCEVYIDDLKITRTDGLLYNNPSGDFEPYVTGTDTAVETVEGVSVKNDDGNIYKEGSYEVSCKDFAGTRALYVNTTGMKYMDKKTMYIGKRADFGLNTTDTYRMEFYIYPVNWYNQIKGVTQGVWVQLNANSRGKFFAQSAKTGFGTIIDDKNLFTITQVTEGSKAGWYKVTSQDLTGLGTWDPYLFIIETAIEAYIDDITMYKVTDGNAEVYASKDFEKHYDLAKNLITTQVSSSQLSVSWKNPSTPAAAEIKIYDAESNKLLAENFDTTAGGFNEFIDTDFTAGVNKVYRVDYIYDDGAVKSRVTGITPGSSGYDYAAGSWTLVSGTEQKPPVIMEVDDKVFKTAPPSIRIASNEELYDKAHAVFQLRAGTKLDTTKTYRVTGWAKKNSAGYIYDRILSSDTEARMYDICGTWNQYQTADWTYFEHEYKPKAENYAVINFTFVAGMEDFWIDDVECYELDADNNPTGENLLAGIGALDSGVAEAPSAPVGVEVTNDVETAIISWSEDTVADYIAVYDEGVSEDIPVAYVPALECYVDIKNLTAGKEYNFTVKAVNAEGRESAEGASVTAVPEAEALVIGEYVTTASGNDVTVNIDVKNNSAGNSITAQLILAVYSGETLETITGTTATSIPQTALGVAPVTLSKSVTVPSGCRLVMYLWDSLEGMRPLKVSQEY